MNHHMAIYRAASVEIVFSALAALHMKVEIITLYGLYPVCVRR